MASKAIIRKLVNADYEGFVKIMDAAKNPVDLFIEVDDVFKESINEGIKTKRDIDSDAKSLKEVQAELKGFLIRYVEEKEVERLDGIKSKSITYTPEKIEKGVESWQEIMVSGKYVNLGGLSKDDLVVMLEKKGVKTRMNSRPARRTRPATVRINR